MRPAQMKGRSSSIGDLRGGRLDLLDGRDAGGALRPLLVLAVVAGRRSADEAQHVEDAGAEDDEVDDDEGDERGADRFGIDVAEAVGGAEVAVDGVGLAADFGGVPAGEDGDEARGRHDHRGAVEPLAGVEGFPPARPERPEAEAEHQEADADHDAEGPERDQRGRPLVGREVLEALHFAIERVLEEERAEVGNFEEDVGLFGGVVGPAEEDQRRALVRLVVPLDRGDLLGLVLVGVEAVLVADEDLDRHDERGHPHRHREHDPRLAVLAVADEVVGPYPADREGGGEEGREHGVNEPVREARVEDDLPPVDRDELADVVDGKARGRLHPAVGGEDPGGGDQGAERDHRDGEHMESRRRRACGRRARCRGSRPRGRRRSGPRSPSAGRSPGRPCPRRRPSWCRTGSS